MRVGIGYDSHRFDHDRPLVLGGITIPDAPGLEAHSDGDAVAHAIIDAILGAAGQGNIGGMFPDTDPGLAGVDSMKLLAAAARAIEREGCRIVNVDAVVVAETPRIGPHAGAMRARIAEALGLASRDVSIKGKSNEGLGWIGRGEGLAVMAVAIVDAAGPGSAPDDG